VLCGISSDQRVRLPIDRMDDGMQHGIFDTGIRRYGWKAVPERIPDHGCDHRAARNSLDLPRFWLARSCCAIIKQARAAQNQGKLDVLTAKRLSFRAIVAVHHELQEKGPTMRRSVERQAFLEW
jgi:hypothetical protein